LKIHDRPGSSGKTHFLKGSSLMIITMAAAAPDGAQSKVDTFSNQSSLMRRLIPRGGPITRNQQDETSLRGDPDPTPRHFTGRAQVPKNNRSFVQKAIKRHFLEIEICPK
jgi:hypothetical protein